MLGYLDPIYVIGFVIGLIIGGFILTSLINYAKSIGVKL